TSTREGSAFGAGADPATEICPLNGICPPQAARERVRGKAKRSAVVALSRFTEFRPDFMTECFSFSSSGAAQTQLGFTSPPDFFTYRAVTSTVPRPNPFNIPSHLQRAYAASNGGSLFLRTGAIGNHHQFSGSGLRGRQARRSVRREYQVGPEWE